MVATVYDIRILCRIDEFVGILYEVVCRSPELEDFFTLLIAVETLISRVRVLIRSVCSDIYVTVQLELAEVSITIEVAHYSLGIYAVERTLHLTLHAEYEFRVIRRRRLYVQEVVTSCQRQRSCDCK